jgi:hypothetical protein
MTISRLMATSTSSLPATLSKGGGRGWQLQDKNALFAGHQGMFVVSLGPQ